MSQVDHLFKGKVPLMKAAMDAYSMRQVTIARNIANATTPNYRPETVRFEEEFEKIRGVVARGQRSDVRHANMGDKMRNNIHGAVEDSAVPAPEVLFSGESHVNVDKEMSELAQNQIRFRFVSRMTSRYFRGLQTAIKGVNQ